MITTRIISRELYRHSSKRCFYRSLSKLRTVERAGAGRYPSFAFAFDVDGVLIRGQNVLRAGQKALSYLNQEKIPYILLTNGGGHTEEARAKNLAEILQVPIQPGQIVQSHTPFSELEEYKNKTVLILGGRGNTCREVAEHYGFKTAVTTSDIFAQYPSIWPFSTAFEDYHKNLAGPRPLPTPIDPSNPNQSLKIDAIFVYNDPRDWSLDTQVIVDCLLSRNGIIGTLSEKNGNADLPNRGYQQEGQPPLYFSNPDLWFSSAWNLPRLGQGGFMAAFEGVWTAVTGGAAKGVELKKHVIGKPTLVTYEFAEKQLYERRKLSKRSDKEPGNDTRFERVFMIGDNPASDIAGANYYSRESKTPWDSLLVKTGVYKEGEPSAQPTAIFNDAFDAVQWAVQDVGWAERTDDSHSDK